MEKCKVVVLVPCPLQGHLPPMLQLGTLLHSRGFSITIAHTSFNLPNYSNYPYFKFVKLEDGLAGCDTSFLSLLTVIPAMNKNSKEPLHKLLTAAEGEEDGGVCCIIYDPIMYYTDTVAKDLKIPVLIFRTNSAAYLQALRVNLKLLAEQHGVLPGPQLQDLVPVLDHLRFKDLPIPLNFRLPDVVLELEEKISSIRSSPLAMILNSTNDLENSVITQLEKDLKIPIFPLGPLHKMISNASNTTNQTEEDRICIEWLNKQAPNSVVYVSFGSVAILEDKDVVEIAWGLANSEQPFLWVVRPGSIQGSKWIEKLPQDFLEKYNKQKGLILKWAPQKEVLAHPGIGVFWSHCGWNSTLESICEVVPMICRPCFADQNVNARYLAHVWKVGLELESPLQRETVENAIRRVMDDDQGKDLKINVLKLKKKLEACVKEDGNSCKFLDKLVDFIHALPREHK